MCRLRHGLLWLQYVRMLYVVSARYHGYTIGTIDVHITDEVFDDQIPADDERGELTNGHVTVDVRRSSFGYSAGELGITQPCRKRFQIIHYISY